MDGIHDLGGKQGHGKVDKGQPSAQQSFERLAFFV